MYTIKCQPIVLSYIFLSCKVIIHTRREIVQDSPSMLHSAKEKFFFFSSHILYESKIKPRVRWFSHCLCFTIFNSSFLSFKVIVFWLAKNIKSAKFQSLNKTYLHKRCAFNRKTSNTFLLIQFFFSVLRFLQSSSRMSNNHAWDHHNDENLRNFSLSLSHSLSRKISRGQ